MSIALVNPELKSAYQRGIYLYAKSLIAGLRMAGIKVDMLTDVVSSLKGEQLAMEVVAQIASPLRDKIRSIEMLPHYVQYRFGRVAAKRLGAAPHGALDDSIEYLKDVEALINAPRFYEVCRLAASKPFLSAVDVDFLARDHGLRTCVTAAPVAIQSRSARVKIVQTVHDLIVLNTDVHNINVSKFERRLSLAVNHADLILAVSQYTKREIVGRYPHVADRVRVVYQPLPASAALVDASADAAIQSEVLARFGLDAGKYVFYVGALEKRKNIGRLVQAFKCSTASKDMLLVIAGALDERYLNDEGILSDFVDEAGLTSGERRSGSVRYIGRISELDKLCLLRQASFFAFPTITEGFGIPLLEAQAMGCPVLATNSSAIPEVVGDSAVLVQNPSDTEEICAQMNRLVSSATLRQRCRQDGLVNSERFSRGSFANNLSALLAELG